MKDLAARLILFVVWPVLAVGTVAVMAVMAAAGLLYILGWALWQWPGVLFRSSEGKT